MTVQLDHAIVPSRNKVAAAKLLGELLGVPWAETGLGPFAPVYVNDGLTLDFIDTNEDFPVYHFCFRVEPFDEATIRAQLQRHGVEAGPVAPRYGAEGEGPSIYLSDPEGNVVELKGPPGPVG